MVSIPLLGHVLGCLQHIVGVPCRECLPELRLCWEENGVFSKGGAAAEAVGSKLVGCCCCCTGGEVV